MIQASRSDFDARELLAMIKEGLNAVMLYAPWLSKLVTVARTDSDVYNALKSLTQITYTGACLNPDDEAWMMENDIPVSVSASKAFSCYVRLIMIDQQRNLFNSPSMPPLRPVSTFG